MELNNSTNLNNSNSTDHCDMTSLEILNKCHLDLFPKKQTVCDDVNCMAIVEQLPILNGEYIQFIGILFALTLIIIIMIMIGSAQSM